MRLGMLVGEAGGGGGGIKGEEEGEKESLFRRSRRSGSSCSATCLAPRFVTCFRVGLQQRSGAGYVARCVEEAAWHEQR